MAQKVSILDLTVDQVEAIEVELGKPIDQWDELPSRMKLFRLVFKAATGEEAGGMSLRALQKAVDLGNEEDAETANPTAPPTG